MVVGTWDPSWVPLVSGAGVGEVRWGFWLKPAGEGFLRLGSFKLRGTHLLFRLGISDDRSDLFSSFSVLFETKLIFVKFCSVLSSPSDFLFSG